MRPTVATSRAPVAATSAHVATRTRRAACRSDSMLGLSRVKAAMAQIGYRADNLHMLDRWYSKATTGKFGR